MATLLPTLLPTRLFGKQTLGIACVGDEIPHCLLSVGRGKARPGLAGRKYVQTEGARLGVFLSSAHVSPSFLSTLWSVHPLSVPWGGRACYREEWVLQGADTKSLPTWPGRQQCSEDRGQMLKPKPLQKGQGTAEVCVGVPALCPVRWGHPQSRKQAPHRVPQAWTPPSGLCLELGSGTGSSCSRQLQPAPQKDMALYTSQQLQGNWRCRRWVRDFVLGAHRASLQDSWAPFTPASSGSPCSMYPLGKWGGGAESSMDSMRVCTCDNIT